jgi:hypothetical protein
MNSSALPETHYEEEEPTASASISISLEPDRQVAWPQSLISWLRGRRAS